MSDQQSARPILQHSFSSSSSSVPSSRPSIMQTNSYQTSTTPPRASTPDLHLPSAAQTHQTHRVSFPWEPKSSPTHDHSNLNSAGLHSAFAHHQLGAHQSHTGSVDSSANTHRDSLTLPAGTSEGGSTAVNSDMNDPTGYYRKRKGSGGGLGMAKTLTGSTIGSMQGEFGYTRKVGFETFEKSTDTALFSYTLQAKSDSFRRTRNTRVFLAAASPDQSGQEALEWLLESLVEDGDEIVACRVVELEEGEKLDKHKQEEFREEAGVLLRKVLELNNATSDRSISVIVEYVAGKITTSLMRLISLYRPDSLIVGTKGTRSKLQVLGKALGAPGMGSVSRYCVSHSPVPVIVVRPERKVKKHLEKRQNDPKRGKYAAMVGDDLTLKRSRSAESRERGGLSDRD